MASLAAQFWNYSFDAWQRSVLFMDVMRRRANQYEEHKARLVPHVLSFDYEPVVDGRSLPQPVNYGLVRIKPPQGVTVDPRRRPYVVIDPRAGHGPGIGGFKADSEIGVALAAGHPCYFVGFAPEPVPGQTIEHIMKAEACFLERVIALHPQADGKPCVIGNCQAGWAILMVAALRPELFGPIIVAGSPLSYWAGVHGANPMRYSGGLLGGSWLTALTGDIGNGKFDGAWLVSNFESLNPANTLWSKQYNLWAKVDGEAERFLEFERWWGAHVNLNAEEMQFIVDQLFVGNRLATGEIQTSDGLRIDLRNIRSPIVCFCSKGDNITPPQQALGWISDNYASVDEIRSHGQTIVYALHENVGHLGIFVSAKVAVKEHAEFASNVDLIDSLAPGLYEAVLVPREGSAGAELASGDWIIRFEPRGLDDIRALGNNDVADEQRFATMRRVSEINHGLYRSFAQPVVRSLASDEMAAMLSKLHPARLPYEALSDRNPFMKQLGALAEQVRANRRAADPDNVFVGLQQQVSAQIEGALKNWGDARDRMVEQAFLAIYGSPALQAAVGLGASGEPPRPVPGRNPQTVALVEARIAELRAHIDRGTRREAAVRALLFAGRGGGYDERHLAMIRRIYERYGGNLTVGEFKQILREQFLMLLIDEEAAVAALPRMAPDAADRQAILAHVREVLGATGALSETATARLARLEELLAVPAAAE
ncbi:MAG: DUF3141 domain-containing protein [Reyranellaceae bacterium]